MEFPSIPPDRVLWRGRFWITEAAPRRGRLSDQQPRLRFMPNMAPLERTLLARRGHRVRVDRDPRGRASARRRTTSPALRQLPADVLSERLPGIVETRAACSPASIPHEPIPVIPEPSLRYGWHPDHDQGREVLRPTKGDPMRWCGSDGDWRAAGVSVQRRDRLGARQSARLIVFGRARHCSRVISSAGKRRARCERPLRMTGAAALRHDPPSKAATPGAVRPQMQMRCSPLRRVSVA